jgi:hypothetical protein
MAFVRQVVSCPVCGASRRLKDFNLDAQGNGLTDPEDRKTYMLVLKTLEMGGGRDCVWTSHDVPIHILHGVAAQMRRALAQVEGRLATLGELG